MLCVVRGIPSDMSEGTSRVFFFSIPVALEVLDQAVGRENNLNFYRDLKMPGLIPTCAAMIFQSFFVLNFKIKDSKPRVFIHKMYLAFYVLSEFEYSSRSVASVRKIGVLCDNSSHQRGVD